MITASEIAAAITAMDIAISFITDAHTVTPSRQRVLNILISARCKLDLSLSGVKIQIENDLKRKEDLP